MVAHHQKKWRRDVIGRGEDGDTVLFLPLTIFNERGFNPGRNQLFDSRSHPIALVTTYKASLSNSRADQGLDCVPDQGDTKHRDERLQKSFVYAAQTRALAGHQDYRFGYRSHKHSVGVAVSFPYKRSISHIP